MYTFHHEDVIDYYHWILRFKDLVVTHGGAVLASGDGLSTYDPSGDVITRTFTTSYSTEEPGGAHNSGAWFRLRLPGGDGAPELLMQNTANGNVQYLIYWSATGFTGGSPSATVRPTADDEFLVIGSGTSGDLIETPEGPSAASGYYSCRLDACFGDAEEGHSFYVWIRHPHSRHLGAGFWFDALEGTHDNDTRPYLFGWLRGSTWYQTTSGRFAGVPSSYPNEGDRFSYLWGFMSDNAEDDMPRPHSVILPVQFMTFSHAYQGDFRVVTGAWYSRDGVARPAGASIAGNPIKGRSRLVRGLGNGRRGSSGMLVDIGGEPCICLDDGVVFARWDSTEPRV